MFYPLKQRFPFAINIRFEGDCPNCNEPELLSFQLEGDDLMAAGHNEEFCGFYCQACDWGNAGRREKYRYDDPQYPPY